MSDEKRPVLSEETPAERKQRLNAAAAFGRFSAWLEAFPKLPAPDRAYAAVILSPKTLDEEAADAQYLLLLADLLGAEAYENDQVLQFDTDVSTLREHGITITYRVTVMKVRTTTRRYVAGTGGASS